jgi:hypothetical protein
VMMMDVALSSDGFFRQNAKDIEQQ